LPYHPLAALIRMPYATFLSKILCLAAVVCASV
jgi:hypothetical protein